MAQANSHNSTRRAFLSTTAVAAAAIVAARAVVLASTQAEDPTFALIETHRVAESEHAAACAEHSLGRLGWLIIWLSVWAFD